jgi:hypothetical protein
MLVSENMTEYETVGIKCPMYNSLPDNVSLPNDLWIDSLYMAYYSNIADRLKGYEGTLHVVTSYVDGRVMKNLQDQLQPRNTLMKRNLTRLYHVFDEDLSLVEADNMIDSTPGRVIVVSKQNYFKSNLQEWYGKTVVESKQLVDSFNTNRTSRVVSYNLPLRYLDKVNAIFFVMPVDNWLYDAWLSKIKPSSIGVYVYFINIGDCDTEQGYASDDMIECHMEEQHGLL